MPRPVGTGDEDVPAGDGGVGEGEADPQAAIVNASAKPLEISNRNEHVRLASRVATLDAQLFVTIQPRSYSLAKSGTSPDGVCIEAI